MKNLLGWRVTPRSTATLAKWALNKSISAAQMMGLSTLLYGALACSATLAQAEETQSPEPKGYIALLLPGNAKAFKPAVDNIRTGVLAAERVHGDADIPLVRVFDTTDKEEDIQAQYKKAVAGGASAVIGPLTKSALNYLADSTELTVPVLALNGFDQTTLAQSKLYSFGLGIEGDAIAAAQLMKLEGVQQPIVLQTADSTGQRLTPSFVASWRALTGAEPVIVTIANPKRDAPALKAQLAEAVTDAIFLAMDAKAARIIRPFLGNERAVYATSQVNPGRLPTTMLVDLTGIKYLDMPWLANPNQEGYELYNRTRSTSNDLERLFALGVDAWQIAAILAKGGTVERLEGLTGTLSLGPDNVVAREMTVRTMGRTETPRE
ncbi:penicillin-binding protein activator [Chitinibacter fontanus]|uniref:Penicillin-binding protein activator n=1 Tax=Chitinibacter fontanus TaxID=1737446 RepID=A0A7D5VBN7_9NEIS|nr:penicillin-binding protein activator [Chitinibacter fontanus]QLI82313.1 penicillin-binding protein activator [Chitinibacter fontanus]